MWIEGHWSYKTIKQFTVTQKLFYEFQSIIGQKHYSITTSTSANYLTMVTCLTENTKINLSGYNPYSPHLTCLIT